MNVFGTVAATLVAASLTATAASAVTVATAGTGGEGFTLSGGGTIVETNHGFEHLYDQSVTTPASTWVWDSVDGKGSTDLTFEVSFDLTGYDIASAEVTGVWGVDNYGYMRLNGTEVASLTEYGHGTFKELLSFSITDDALFQDGINTLSFQVVNELVEDQGPAAFRAALSVLADFEVVTGVSSTNGGRAPAPVPLPASVLMLGAALAGLGLARRRRAV